jgi:DNA primase
MNPTSENQAVLQELARMAGYTLPELKRSPEEIKRDQDLKQKGEAQGVYWEWARNLLFQPEGSQTFSYLNLKEQEKRGYTDDDIRKMGLGHNAGFQKSLEYLLGKGFSEKAIEAGLKWLKFRDAYKVVIPHFDLSGKLIGLWGRVIDPSFDPKKKYRPFNDGTAIGDIPFGIETCIGQTTVYGVEGILDALYPAAKGLRGVVGWGRQSPSRAQLEVLKGLGVKNLVLVPDNDDQGREGVERAIRVTNE